MYAAVRFIRNVPLVLWLVDKKGADIDARLKDGQTPLHAARSLKILKALLACDADPTALDYNGTSPLMCHAFFGRVDIVARLLQDPRVRETIDLQDKDGDTALHFACNREDMDDATAASIIYLLLQANANPLVTNNTGRGTPLALVLRYVHGTTYTTTIALLEQALVATEVTALLVKARRLVVAATTDVIPSYLQGRVERGQDLPRVELVPVTENEEDRKFRSMTAFLFDMRSETKGEGMPRDVFRDVFMDLLMPVWDPLRRKRGDAGQPQRG